VVQLESIGGSAILYSDLDGSLFRADVISERKSTVQGNPRRALFVVPLP
jgi:hypothetical protein